MRLEGVELRLLDLPLHRPIGTAAGPHVHRAVALVRVVADGRSGWGECGALPGGTSVDPSLEEVWPALRTTGAERLRAAARARDGELPGAAMTGLLFDAHPLGRMMSAAFEMALFDLELRAETRSLAGALSVEEGKPVPIGALVGIPEDRAIDTLLRQADETLTAGYSRLRMKIGPGWDVEPAAALRRRFPDLILQLDANGCYQPGDADHLKALDDLGITCLEQPFPPSDLPGHAVLANLLETPIGLDESLVSPRRVADAIRYGACEVACLKPARLGGLLAARAALARCTEHGVPAFVGGLFETGLGRSALVALAGLDGFILPGDLTPPRNYLVEDPFDYPEPAGGAIRLPATPGVGPEPDPGTLDRLTAETAWLPYEG